LLLPLPVLHNQPQTNGCPIHRALCDGWGCKPSAIAQPSPSPLPLPLLLLLPLALPCRCRCLCLCFCCCLCLCCCRAVAHPPIQQRTVISTEAAHAFVSGAVEKSASPPLPSLSQHRAFGTRTCFSLFSATARNDPPLPIYTALGGDHNISNSLYLRCDHHHFSFAIFCPKNACQVPNPLKSLKQKEIELAW
jgi:hypothetical protein